MTQDPAWIAAGVALAVLLGLLNLVLLLARGSLRAEARATRQVLEVMQSALHTGQRAEAEAVRSGLAQTERALAAKAEDARLEAQVLRADLAREHGEQRVRMEAKLRELGEQTAQRLTDIQRSVNQRLTDMADRQAQTERTLVAGQAEQRLAMEQKLREMQEQLALRLAEIQSSVNERLAEAVEKQVQGSFQRVIDQFAQVQKAMVDVQAVTSQIGDLKRVFTNVKSRGGWGEAQLRALLTDIMPDGGWEENRKLRPDSDEAVEFVLVMPAKGSPRPLLALDAKFPAEDYDRLLQASEAGSVEDERAARRALEVRLRAEAKKIAEKYIVAGVTVDYAVMYLPTDSLYVEAARMPGLIESLGRTHRILVVGPSLLAALVRTIHVGAMSLTIAEKAKTIEDMLGAVRTEFRRIDGVLGKLEKQSGTVNRNIAEARKRTQKMDRTLSKVTVMGTEQAEQVLQLEQPDFDEEMDEAV